MADAALLLLAALDLLRTPAPGALAVERELPERAGLSQELERVVRVAPGRAAGLELELREAFPASFEVVGRTVDGAPAAPQAGDPTGGPDGGRLPSDAALSLVRRYRPARRGVQRLGALRLRVGSPLRLFWREALLAGDQDVAVEPALVGLGETLRLAASERWRELGLRIPRRGGLSAFESLREYAVGDDPRTLDWKATARRGRPVVRQYQLERGQELILAIDCGRRMLAATTVGPQKGWSKLDQALDAAFQLAAVALEAGDRVGLVAYDRELCAWVPPARGARAFARLMEAAFALEPESRESDLDRALSEIAVRHRRRSLVVVLSDVADLLSVERERAALARGARRARIVFAALDDPDVRAAAEWTAEPGPDTSPLRAAALGEQHDRRRALRRLACRGVRVLSPLPAEAAGALLEAWLSERRAPA